MLLEKKLFRLVGSWTWAIIYILWISTFTGYTQNISYIPSGVVGYEINMFLIDYIGDIGIALLLIFSGLSFIVIKLNITPKKSIDFIKDLFKAKEIGLNEEILGSENQENNFIENSDEEISVEIQDEVAVEIQDEIPLTNFNICHKNSSEKKRCFIYGY